jgi:hypothetical protein
MFPFVPIVFNSMVSRVSSTGNAAIAQLSDSAQLQVSYTYAPAVPEPSHLTLGLFAMGLAAKLILRKHRSA